LADIFGGVSSRDQENLGPAPGPLDDFAWPSARALVLGGTGMIGCHTVRALLRRGARVRVLARPSSTTRTLEGLAVERLSGDLEDPASVRAALPGCDLLFHCAAPYPRSHFHRNQQVTRARRSMAGLLSVVREFVPRELLDPPPGHLAARAVQQAEGAAHAIRLQPERAEELARMVRNSHLLEAALAGRLNASLHPPLSETMHLPGLKRIVYTSSLTTIGRPLGRDRSESWPRLADERDRYDLAGASSPYFAMKAEMEAEATRAAVEGMPVIIGNPSLCVDAYDPTPTTGKLLVAVARRSMPVYLPGVMNVVATRDVGEALVNAAVLGRTGHRYILGGDNTTTREFLGLVAQIAGVPPPRMAVPIPLAEALAYASEVLNLLRRGDWAWLPVSGVQMMKHSQALDCSLAHSELQMPSTPIATAVADAFRWLKENGYL
jgi:nucleoside-diphosphate-sugar epimerase